MPPNKNENITAKKNVAIPIKNPIIANNTFIAIRKANPSKSHENIIPGNLTDLVAHHIKTSPI